MASSLLVKQYSANIMLTQSFQHFLLSLAFICFSVLISYGVYCRRRYNSFYGTGRIADMEIWHLKGTVAWLSTFILFVALLINFS